MTAFIAREEALTFIMRCTDSIRKMYSSWKQLSVSNQFARCVWNGPDEDVIMEMSSNMEMLLTNTRSAWVKLPFRT